MDIFYTEIIIVNHDVQEKLNRYVLQQENIQMCLLKNH